LRNDVAVPSAVAIRARTPSLPCLFSSSFLFCITLAISSSQDPQDSLRLSSIRCNLQNYLRHDLHPARQRVRRFPSLLPTRYIALPPLIVLHLFRNLRSSILSILLPHHPSIRLPTYPVPSPSVLAYARRGLRLQGYFCRNPTVPSKAHRFVGTNKEGKDDGSV
jgi:hypothetical protein